jgi:hypothetical protein
METEMEARISGIIYSCIIFIPSKQIAYSKKVPTSVTSLLKPSHYLCPSEKRQSLDGISKILTFSPSWCLVLFATSLLYINVLKTSYWLPYWYPNISKHSLIRIIALYSTVLWILLSQISWKLPPFLLGSFLMFINDARLVYHLHTALPLCPF